MRDRTVVLAVEDPSCFSRISTVVHSGVGARLLVDSFAWIPLLCGRPTEGKSGRVVLVLFGLCGIIAVFLVDVDVGAILRWLHLLLPSVDISSFVIPALLIVVAVAEWRCRWPEGASVIVLASTVAIRLIAAQDGAIPVGLVAAARITWVRHSVGGALVRILGSLVRALSEEFLSESCFVVVVLRLSHLHLKLYLILGPILRRCLGVVVALNI